MVIGREHEITTIVLLLSLNVGFRLRNPKATENKVAISLAIRFRINQRANKRQLKKINRNAYSSFRLERAIWTPNILLKFMLRNISPSPSHQLSTKNHGLNPTLPSPRHNSVSNIQLLKSIKLSVSLVKHLFLWWHFATQNLSISP